MLLWPLLIATSFADSPNIVGGELAQAGDWPSVVALRTGGDFLCTGTLISSDVVLTAAHCSAADNVVLDSIDLSEPALVVAIDAFHVYPSWSTTYDVAWVRLKTSVSTVPARLLTDCLADSELVDGATATLTGFGTLDEWSTEETDLLHQADVPILDADCSESQHGCMTSIMPGGELTAGGDGVDSCVGDSGGGLWVGNPDKPYLAGVTSRARLPVSTPCGDGGIYVRVDAVADWIESEANLVLERPTCEGEPINHPPEPSAAVLIVAAFGSAATTIEPGDVDPEDEHSFSLQEGESGMTLLMSDHGLISVQDTLGTPRSGSFRVIVTDDGTPARSGEVSVLYTVTPDPTAGGCRVQPTPMSGWALPLWIGILVRRRR